MRRADVSVAADRPDRLELEVVDGDDEGIEARGGAPLGPGRPVEVFLNDSPLFSGRVDRCGLRCDPLGRRWLVVAYAEYERFRVEASPATYFQTTDSEIATRIAAELGLRPRVERTLEVFPRLERREDPLRFLRRRARDIGFEFAVAEGELHFASTVPLSDDRAPLRVDCRSDLLALDVEDRGLLGRGGSLRVSGDPAWRPLVSFDVDGYGPAWDARYRVVRCRHYLSGSGYRCLVHFLEEGLDFALWRGEGETIHG